MRIRVIAVGTKMPGWVQSGVGEYQKRLPREWRFEWLELPLAHRSKSADSARAVQKEGEAILSSLASDECVVALEVKGKRWSTEDLARSMNSWQMDGSNVTFLIGGPDGLSDACRRRANVQWSLSELTLPHPLVRIVLTEQLYRAWSVNSGHPYHK